MDADISIHLQEQIILAQARSTALAIVGSASKDFLGRRSRGQVLSVAGHCGIVSYDPTELVITARAGTPLRELQAALAEKGQMLPFDPPCYAAGGTFGGMIAAGLSGPRRPFAGSLRDAVLGLRCLDGQGRLLSFGGQVVKNVAGFDLSRLLSGSMGTLAVILEASLRVVPCAATEITLLQSCDQAAALTKMQRLACAALPLSAMAWQQGQLMVRLSGNQEAVSTVREEIGAVLMADDAAKAFWSGLRDQRLPFFSSSQPLWRLSLPAAAAPFDGDLIIDWGGAQRWLKSAATAADIRQLSRNMGGSADCFRGGDRDGEVYQPLAPALMALQQRIKQVFDPQGLFNRGRLYAALPGPC